MLRSLYTAGTAMLTNTRRMDVITNNLTNVETRGYRADTLVTQSFRDMVISRINDPNIMEATGIGHHNTGIHIDRIYTSFVPGSLENTGISTDFAMPTDGFFVVSTPDGERYTRSGNFNVDAAGLLVTPLGSPVMGQNGPIQVGTTDFTVSAEGVVSVAGVDVGQLRTVTFPDNNGLRKEKDNLFSNFDPAGNTPVVTPVEVKQGYLENANVDTAREMVDMMTVYRSYEINQRVLRMMDESLGRAVNDIARV